MMTSRERLMAILQGLPHDRPGVNFYEIGGFDIHPDDPIRATFTTTRRGGHCCNWRKNTPI